jgi:hypothetical protein
MTRVSTSIRIDADLKQATCKYGAINEYLSEHGVKAISLAASGPV